MEKKNRRLLSFTGKMILASTLFFTLAFSYFNSSTFAYSPQMSVESTQSLDDSIIKNGLKYLGVPYRRGAEYSTSGRFDCSSFTRWIFAKNGIRLPRTSYQQSRIGKYVSPKHLKKGDLIFTSTSYSHGKVAHVGVYMGNGELLHTYGPGGVRIDKIRGSWLEKRYVTARRVIH